VSGHDTSRIENEIDAAMRFNRRLDRTGHLIGVSHISRHEVCGFSQGIRDLAAGRRRQVENGDTPSLVQQSLGGPAPEAGRSSGDQGNRSVDIHPSLQFAWIRR
jgi:hypothetical protein